eukprot:PhF_6_TR24328/c0_g1_i1/m.33760
MSTATVRLMLSGSVGSASGKTITHDLNTSQKVIDVEKQILTNWSQLFPDCSAGLEPNMNLHLLKNGQILNKEKTLAECQVSNDSVIHVVLLQKLTKGSGGGPSSTPQKTAAQEDAEASSKKCCVMQ